MSDEPEAPPTPAAPAVTGKMAEVKDLPPAAAKAAETKALAGVDAAILGTAGQRRVNLLWEVTQSAIALAVTLTTLFVSGRLAISGSADTAAFLLLSNAFFLVIGFYFGRTNHQKMGGVAAGDAGR